MPKGSNDGSVYWRAETRRANGKEKEVRQYYARVRYREARGRVREWKRRAQNYAHACELRRELLARKERGEQFAPPQDKTFRDLAAYYQREYVVPPRYVQGVKVAGLRSYKSILSGLRLIIAYFGDGQLRALDYEALQLFKTHLLNLPTPKGQQRSITSVNRHLQILSRMLKLAHRPLRWIAESPFSDGDTLISKAGERERSRILSRDEESRMLSVCVDKREHLRPALICALDTALRAGEQFTLLGRDVNLVDGIITVRAFNAKTEKARIVPLSERLRDELLKINFSPDGLVFPQRCTKRAFLTALRVCAGMICGIRQSHGCWGRACLRLK